MVMQLDVLHQWVAAILDRAWHPMASLPEKLSGVLTVLGLRSRLAGLVLLSSEQPSTFDVGSVLSY